MVINSRKTFVPYVLAGVILLIGSASVLGCECATRNDFEIEFALSKAVFVGEVIDMDNARPDATVTFQVNKMWKGAKSETVAVKTNNRGKACGFPFTRGERYLVYAYDDGSLRTSICTRTAPAGYAGDDIKRLDDTGWSAPVNGLRARLSVVPSDKPDSPFCRVFIEMQNVSNIMGQKKIRFDPDRLELKVTDVKDGKPLAPTDGMYDGFFHPGTRHRFRMGVRQSFRLVFPARAIAPPTRSSSIWARRKFGSSRQTAGICWPENSLYQPRKVIILLDWSGTLELPAVRIPKAK